jgi:ribosomal-protein-alanine N-acetyltransferase
MQHSEIKTNRTILRPFSKNDAILSFSWFGDPEVMKFTPNGPDAALEDTVARIARYQEHHEQHGYAKWIILERDSMKPMGDAGPMYFPECQHFELGYRLLPEYWNKGFATEVASAWVRECFHRLDFKILIAFTHPGNLASIRVLEKVGFKFSHREYLMGMESMVYQITSYLSD